MLVTHTQREIVPVLPRFRIVAVSMERLPIGRARIAAIAINVIDLDPVVVLEEQPAISTAPVLLFEQLRQSRTGARVPSLSGTPVHPLALIGTAVACDLDMPRDGHLTMGVEAHGIGGCGRGGKDQAV